MNTCIQAWLVVSSFSSLVYSLVLSWLVHKPHMVPIFLLTKSSYTLQLVSVGVHLCVQ